MKYILSLSMLAGSALAAKGGNRLFEALGQAASNGQGKGSSNPGKGHAHGHDHDHSYVDHGRHCPSDKLKEEAEARNPGLAARRRNLDAYTKKFEDHVKSNNGNGNNGKRGLLQTGAITIPVYYHVLVRTQSSVPDADLQAQLDVINEDFGSYNSELGGSLPNHFTNNGWDDDLAGDFGISYTWNTNDINRVTTRDSFSSNDDIKRSNRGGSDHVDGYLNIWVGTLANGLLGYASFPGDTPSLDGVVIGTGTMPGGSSTPYDKGRTLTHEIGHWLNLRHIWGDGGCNADDGVSDTPPDNGANFDCPSNSFSSGCSGGDAMWMNFMDYTDDACMWMFTEGQKIRALAAIQLYRDEFLTGGCDVIPGCASYNTDCACTACRFGSYDNGDGGCDSCQCGGCNDYPNWYDSDGPAYDCTWYSGGSRCASYGSGYANGNCYGESCTANAACCTCGGGESAGDCTSPATCSSFCGSTCGPVGPTPPTTAQPTPFPTTAQPTGSPTTRQPTTADPTGSPTTRQPTPPPTTRQPTTQCGGKKAPCNSGNDCCSGSCNTRKNWCR